MFEESVHNQQGQYEGVLKDGQNLHRLSHPRAEPVLSTQLQQLQQKWKQLKGKIHSRSEALTSSLLEIHGLQDSIDELSEWVVSAEEDMSNAEGLPVGDDLESVEDQLNLHEVMIRKGRSEMYSMLHFVFFFLLQSFQEEMAKQQPKMEALNKANKRRKSRVSLTAGSSANPEITKKISSLDKRWTRLWLRSNERHRQLLEARTRLKDIALARYNNNNNSLFFFQKCFTSCFV